MTRSNLILFALVGGAGLLAAAWFLTPGGQSAPGGVEQAPGTQPGPLTTEMVGVADSAVRFPTPVEKTIGSSPVKLVLTGTALRKKAFFNVYAVGSYIQEGVNVSSAEELCSADRPKQLHLVMERDVTGKQMAEALSDAVRKTYPKPQFDAEIDALNQNLRTTDISKGAEVWLTSVPGRGLHVSVVGKVDVSIDNPAFARAIWEVYLGPNNLGDTIKKGLVSRVK